MDRNDEMSAGADTDIHARVVDRLPLGQLSLGIAASMLFATTAAAQTTLPPLAVETKKAPPKAKAKAKAKQAPVAATPAPAAPVLLADPADATPKRPASPSNSLDAGTGIGRLPGTVQDQPQTVSVIGQTQIREENITTLEQALRGVPGVTVAIGEGGGGMNGDQFRIRGFQAKGDIYIDGLRDFGVYVRDSFAYEQVQVIKGPSSETFGMGTTGGAINIQQKTAHLGDETSVEVSVGTGPLVRTTIDVNKQINATTAARIVGLYHDQDLVDRDHLYSDRSGVLASLAFGLGTDEKLTVNYLHQSGKRKPDMGVPIFDPDGTAAGSRLGKPVTEFGVSRKNFYGKETDLDDSDVDMLTARYTKRVNEALTIYNDTRLAMYSRYFAQTVVSCATGSACGNSILDGTFNGAYAFGGPAGFDQESWGIQNVTTALAKFHTGQLRHEFVAGIDVFYQNDRRTNLGNFSTLQPGVTNAAKTPGTIGNPLYQNPPDFYVAHNQLARKKAEADNIAFFASDRVWLTPEFSVLGGIRWDSYSATYRATNTTTGSWTGGTAIDTSADTDFWSPKASVIWEPTKQQTYYVSYAKSFSSLAGQFITNDNASVGNATQEPEENKLWEIGAKWSLLDGRLGATAALFRVDKTNATVDDGTGSQVPTGEEQRVQGVELGLTGQLTSAWAIQAAYAYMDSEILGNAATTGNNPVAKDANKGNRVSFVPEHAVSVWSTVEISKLMHLWPGKTTIGGGVRWTDENYANSGNTSIIPANFSFDAMISYEKDGWRFAANGYNLTDELNYDASFGNRAVVAPGRTLLFTVGKKF